MAPKRASILLAVCVSLVCLVMLEVAAYVMFTYGNMSSGKRMVLSAVENGGRYVSVKDSYITSHPYLLYAARPGFEDFGFTQINSLGYRGHVITQEKAAGTYRILCLGGSTTFSYPYIQDPSRTWPGLLETSLNEHYPQRHFEVVNAGLPYATTAELLAGYMFRHRYLHPDLVIVHEGGNDVSPLMYEDYTPEYTHFRAPGIHVLLGGVERALLHSYIFRVFYTRYWHGVPTIYVAEPYGAEDLDRNATLKRVQDTYPAGFERNLDLIMRTAQQDGARVMLAGFVSAREEIACKNWPSSQGLEHAIVVGTQKDLAVMAALADKYHTPYLSPADVHMKDEWFVDGCHLNQEGEQAKADWILAGVIRMLDGTP